MRVDGVERVVLWEGKKSCFMHGDCAAVAGWAYRVLGLVSVIIGQHKYSRNSVE